MDNEKELVYEREDITDYLRYIDRQLRLLYIEEGDYQGYADAREKLDDDLYKLSKGNLDNITKDMCHRLYLKHIVKPQYGTTCYFFKNANH